MNLRKPGRIHDIWNAIRIEILDAGYAQLDESWNFEHLRPPYSRLYYTVEGGGTVICGEQYVELKPRHIYLLPAGATIRTACPHKMTQLYFHVSVCTANGYDIFSQCDRVLELSADHNFLVMVDDFLSDDYLRIAMLKCRIETALCYFIAAARLESTLAARHSPFLEQVFDVVRCNLRSSLTIEKVAQEMNISKSTLSKRFRQEFCMTLGHYIDEMLLQEVQRLLAATDLTIGQIAERLAFCDQFYLARFFSSRQGTPPSEYRARLRNQI